MATRKQKAKVGFFLVICALIIVGGVILISGLKKEPSIRYWIEFEESVAGLGTGGQVMYLGVPVGTVSDIYVTDDNKAHVTIQINPTKVTLREGVEAQLVLYSFATGSMVVALSGGELTGPKLPAGSEIASRVSTLGAVSSRIESILRDLDSIIGTVKTGLVGMEEGDLARVVDNAGSLLDNANQMVVDVKEDAQSGIEAARKLVEDVNQAVNVIREKIEVLKVSETEKSFNDALNKIADLAESLDTSAKIVNDAARSAEHHAVNLEFNLRETLRTLNDSLNAVRDLANYLHQNPSSLIRGKAVGE